VPLTPVDFDDRDLTDWLVRQLTTDLAEPSTADMRQLNADAARVGPSGIPIPFIGPLCIEKAIVAKAAAYEEWIDLVKYNARYHYKEQNNALLGNPIRLCNRLIDCYWLKVNTPGNITFGYIGSTAGFTPFELHGGGGAAEICDPKYTANQPPHQCPWTGWFFDFHNVLVGFDEPDGYAAVELGIELYSIDPNQVTTKDFGRLLEKYLPRLSVGQRPAKPYYNPIYGHKYPRGFFDGPG
jgi:hypothetical protein